MRAILVGAATAPFMLLMQLNLAASVSPLVNRELCASEAEAEQGFRLPAFLPGGDETELSHVSHYGALCLDSLVRMGPRRHGGTEVRIAVLGGGQAAGHACHVHLRDGATPNCAWPGRLADVLEKRHPSHTYRVENFARGGSNSCSLIPSLPHLRGYDAILLDFATGDALSHGDGGGRSPAACLEYLLRVLSHGHRSRAGPEAILLATTATCRDASLASSHNLTFDGCLERLDRTADTYKELARRYGVPFLDLHRLIWRGQKPQDMEGGALLEVWGEDHAHPRGEIHDFISWAVARFFGGLVWQACEGCEAAASAGGNGGVPAVGSGADAGIDHGGRSKEAGEQEACESYESEWDAGGADPGEPTVVSGDWELVNDPPGQPGWVSHQEGSALDFPVRFGRVPFLTVEFMRRHRDKGAGDIEVSLPQASPPGDTARVSGARDDRRADPDEEALLFLQAGLRLGGSGTVRRPNEAAGLGADPSSEAVVRVVHAPAPPGRAGGFVKVVKVLTC